MTLYICTAGTSIAGGPIRPGETGAALLERIDAKLMNDRANSKSTQQLLVRASAETNGLVRNKAARDDEVVFLTSETQDGALCGEKLVSLVAAELGCRGRTVGIKGLQVSDGRRFRTIGIPSLFEAIERETKDRAPDEIQLNATGGFKGTVPYLVLYGMFHGLPVSYVYEFSESLITLPPLAVEFDWERIAPAEPAILALFMEGAIARERWRGLMPADYEANRDRYDPLFEFDDDLVGLSAIGHLMKSRLEAVESEAEVFLSASALAVLNSSQGGARAQFESMLSRVRNPLHRSGCKHAETLRKTGAFDRNGNVPMTSEPPRLTRSSLAMTTRFLAPPRAPPSAVTRALDARVHPAWSVAEKKTGRRGKPRLTRGPSSLLAATAGSPGRARSSLPMTGPTGARSSFPPASAPIRVDLIGKGE